MNRGKFIVFEGLDGSGKSTQVALLKKRLDASEIACHFTKEPSDGAAGRAIREVLAKKTVLDNQALALLFVADRVDHIQRELLPALAAGKHVVSDRFSLSSIAYQSLHMPMQTIVKLHEMMVMPLLRPDVTVFLDAPPASCMARIESGRPHRELFEERTELEGVRENFHRAMALLRGRETILCIDAAYDADALFEKIWLALRRYFEI